MHPSLLIFASIFYVAILFLVAYWAERRAKKGKSLVNNPYIYALSLAVYCTAWTYYGNVGRAATSGWGFLPIFLGPTIIAPLWMIVLKKIIIISKSQRINSIADFISSRYGKSIWLGVLATLISVFGIIPYISIQLKAIASTFDILISHSSHFNNFSHGPIYQDTALYIAIALVVFTVLFGTRHLDANERHEGLVAAIAFESVFKLVAFLTAGIFITFILHNGVGDIFEKASDLPIMEKLYDLEASGINGGTWFFLMVLSMMAIMFLPRQFHVSVVENTNSDFLKKASWLFPLYLFLINLFVLPIALSGLIQYPEGLVNPDTFVLSIPLDAGKDYLALFVALGGFSAATSMVIMAVIALSIMISNNLVLPLLIRSQTITNPYVFDVSKRLLGIRRVSIILVVLLAYGYFKSVGQGYTLVSIGLISFTAVAQFAPVILGGIFWKRGTKAGAFIGLSLGFLIWAFTLPLPTLAETGVIDDSFITNGIFGISILKPYALFGLEGFDHISHAVLWSLSLNFFGYYFGSLFSRQDPVEITQADYFVNVYKYRVSSQDFEVLRKKARISDLRNLTNRFLGEKRLETLFAVFEEKHGLKISELNIAPPELVNYIETNLAGSIGAASAKVIINSIAKEDPISLEEMFRVLEQTQEVIKYSKQLELKSAELEATTLQLKIANHKLKELDQLKAEFITTVTHELRTPITSIKSLGKILQTNPDLSETKKGEYLEIIVTESERLSRLVNQVLDLEKIQASDKDADGFEDIPFSELVRRSFLNLKQLMTDRNIRPGCRIMDAGMIIRGNYDQLTQVVVNLISNAIKFCPPVEGIIEVTLAVEGDNCVLKVSDNGVGIPPDQQEKIFEKFTQVSNQELGKPAGSGLGLFITKRIIENHKGSIEVSSRVNFGTTFKIILPLLKKESISFGEA
ncbi:MAG: sensor histidine kinase [Saprospiraceae bacterium]